MSWSRRQFLGAGLAGAFATFSHGAFAALPAVGERRLAFANLHTGEKLSTVYWADGRYLGTELSRIDYLLRDFRTGDVAAMDPKLLDLLHALGRKLDSSAPFQVISGYRSPHTNALLRQRGGGVARRSLHMKAKAIDIRLPGCRLSDLRKAALSLRRGGVGYYPKSGFVHVDTGRVRFW